MIKEEYGFLGEGLPLNRMLNGIANNLLAQ